MCVCAERRGGGGPAEAVRVGPRVAASQGTQPGAGGTSATDGGTEDTAR